MSWFGQNHYYSFQISSELRSLFNTIRILLNCVPKDIISHDMSSVSEKNEMTSSQQLVLRTLSTVFFQVSHCSSLAPTLPVSSPFIQKTVGCSQFLPVFKWNKYDSWILAPSPPPVRPFAKLIILRSGLRHFWRTLQGVLGLNNRIANDTLF